MKLFKKEKKDIDYCFDHQNEVINEQESIIKDLNKRLVKYEKLDTKLEIIRLTLQLNEDCSDNESIRSQIQLLIDLYLEK